MTTVTVDGCLPAALDRLYAAVAALLDERKEMVDGSILAAPSVYDQLVDAVPSTPGGEHRRGRRTSIAPVWCDAVDLVDEVDTAVGSWHPVAGSTQARLRGLAARKWRPQDTRAVEQIAGIVESWVVQIMALLEPAHVKSISAPCPACGATTVYRRNSAGELVRQPALQIVAEHGCTCQACSYMWAPSHYLHLCRVLGFDLPEGVLE
jgi:hypothetical protein